MRCATSGEYASKKCGAITDVNFSKYYCTETSYLDEKLITHTRVHNAYLAHSNSDIFHRRNISYVGILLC